MAKSLIAGVGHRYWGDRSAGPLWIDRAASLDWPDHVVLDDYSFGAVAMVQQLQEAGYERALFVSAETRDRAPATLHLERYTPRHEPPERVQAFIGEAGGGVVAIDLLLGIAEHFDALPPETWVLEVEPADATWGDGLSPEVEALYPRVVDVLRSFARGEMSHDA